MDNPASPVRMDKPMLFSAPMVRALLREAREPGTGKTQTRRVLKPQLADGQTVVSFRTARCDFQIQDATGLPVSSHALPYAVGARLWVREAWRSTPEWNAAPPHAIQPGYTLYEADGPWRAHSYGKLRSSLFMPRWASRLTLIVTEVRVERLNDISEADAVAEGCEARPFPGPWWQGYRDFGDGELAHQQAIGDQPPAWMIEPHRMGSTEHLDRSARDEFVSLWNSLHGPDAWTANPWVCAVSFRPILANIDALPSASQQAADVG